MSNTKGVVKKTQQRLHFLRILKLNINAFWPFIDLQSNCPWIAGYSALELKKNLQWVMKTAYKIIDHPLSSSRHFTLPLNCCLNHQGLSPSTTSELLPSGRQACLYSNCFFPTAISIIRHSIHQTIHFHTLIFTHVPAVPVPVNVPFLRSFAWLWAHTLRGCDPETYISLYVKNCPRLFIKRP